MTAMPIREDATGYRLDRSVVERIASERGWDTSDKIAESLGVDRSMYFRYLAGTHMPLLDTAMRMAERAGLPVNELFVAASPVEAA
jgi:transcriptional regulator with XRE-family HTH domain